MSPLDFINIIEYNESNFHGGEFMKPMYPIYIALLFSIACLFLNTFVFRNASPKISYVIAILALIVSIIAVWISFHIPLGI